MANLEYPTPDLVEGPTLLRPWTLGDLACVEEASTDPRIPEGTTVPSVHTAEAHIARVEAWVEPQNVVSQRVLRSAGFEHEGTLRSFLSFPSRRADAMVFSRVATA